MKKIFILLPIFSLWVIPILVGQGTTDGKDHQLLLQQEKEAHASLLEFRSNPATNNYDLKYHRLEWKIDPNRAFIQGTVTSYFVPGEADFQQLNFDLSDVLTVASVRRKGQALEFTQSADDLLTIFFPNPLPKGILDSVSVTYQGVPETTGFDSFVQSTHNGQPIVWTLSEPYGAKTWWPCKQDLNDKIDSIDILVTTPGVYRAAGNGLLVEESVIGTQKRYHWKHRYPIAAYLIGIAVTNYAVYSDFVPNPNGDPIEVLNYVYPEALTSARASTPRTVPIMQLYNERFGLYPFAAEKYGHAMFGFGGGMEHQTMSFMNGFSHLLIAHELAHQWFGDKVTCGSWSDIWLNEGFATYLEGLTYESGLGSNTWLNWKLSKVKNITSQAGGSVFVTDTTTINRIFSGRLSYDKGAMVLHMLRWKLGDAAFFQGVKNYLNDPKLAYGYARTADLKRHLEQASGLDLTEFLDDWYYGQGFPSYELVWEADGNRLVIVADQTTSHPSVDFFEMPLPILVTGPDRDTLLRVEHRNQGQRFEFNLPFVATGVVFDPNSELISAQNTVRQGLVPTREVERLDRAIRIFPNPATDVVQVQAIDPELHIQLLTIFDASGRQVLQVTEPVGDSVFIGTLPAGIYLLRVGTNRGMIATRLVKN